MAFFDAFCKRQRQKPAYMTLEAALIMPIVLFLVFFLIYVSFLEHDRCVAEQGCKAALLRASIEHVQKNSDVEEKLRRDSNLRKRLAWSSITVQTVHKGNCFEAAWSGGLRIPMNLGGNEQTQNLSFSEKHQVKEYDPVIWIRKCRLLEEINGICK